MCGKLVFLAVLSQIWHLPFKIVVVIFPFLDDMHKVCGKNKRYPFPLHAKLALEVAQEVTKVDVEQLISKYKKQMT